VAESSERFEARLKRRCLEGLGRGYGFAALLDSLEGADPLASLGVLREVAADGSSSAGGARRCVEEASLAAPPPPPSELPIVHPLDYHWRFSPATVDRLLDRAADLSAPGDTVVFLGTPSLCRPTAERLPGRRCVMLDRDRRIVEVVRAGTVVEAHTVDLLVDPLPDLEAKVAIADPPWYPEAFDGFAAAAAQMLGTGGALILSFPASLTRPGVEGERADFLDRAATLGLDRAGHERLALRYETPPFEFAAMGAAGLPSPPPEWRRGDLLTLGLCRRVNRPRCPQGAAEPWLAHQFEQIPVRVRPSAPASGSQLIGTLLAGDILPSVSRRSPLRSEAALWTSRNRVFVSSDPRRLAEILAAAERGEPQAGAAAEVLARVRSLVALERREHGLAGLSLTAAA
jgi:hypothetical protein